MLEIIRFITSHPLNLNASTGCADVSALCGEYPVAAWNDGATRNLYCGLHEPDEMAFVLHALGPDETFVDVGANVGGYTVPAAKAVQARTIAVEPVPEVHH